MVKRNLFIVVRSGIRPEVLALVTVVVEVAELLPAAGSGVDVVADAVLEITLPLATDGPTCTTRVIVADAPAAMDPNEHVTDVVPAHEPSDGMAETYVVPAGSASLTVASRAFDGPLLVTWIV